jgi:serine/threonine-protein kinase
VLLYELLTGRVPFEGDSAVAIALQHLSAEPLPPSSLNPRVPTALDQVVLRALAKDPQARYPDAPQFIAALQAARGALSSGPPTERHTPAFAPTTAATAGALIGQGLVVGLPSQPAGVGSPPPGRHSGSPSRRRWWWAALAVVVAAGAIVAAIVLSSSKSDVTLPTLTGQSEAIAIARLKALGMKPSVTRQSSVGVPAGAVIAQRPRAGSVVQSGARVYLTVSGGPAIVEVPSVAGMIEARALKTLSAVGLQPRMQSQPARHVHVGYVISTNPPAGLEAVQGTPVTVEVSSGPAGSAAKSRVHVPNITGLPESAAAAALSSVGLTVGTVTERGSSSQAPGTVLAQTPAGGALLPSGGSVALVVAQATSEVEVPDVVGSTRTGAEATLRATGLSPASTTRSVTNPAENGTVLEETPETGEKVKRGETVTIVVGTLSEQVTTTTAAPTE